MPKIIRVAQRYPAYHPKAGQPTHFVDKICGSLAYIGYGLLSFPSSLLSDDWYRYNAKRHTIRAGHRWNAGEMASIRVWSDKPYRSPTIELAVVQLIKVIPIEISESGGVTIAGQFYGHMHQLGSLASNDGLTPRDLADWFHKLPFSGQILVWDDSYLPYGDPPQTKPAVAASNYS